MSDQFRTVTLNVPDISCGHCEATIRATLADLGGVTSADPSASAKQVVVTFDPDRVSPERIAAALDEAGYPVGD